MKSILLPLTCFSIIFASPMTIEKKENDLGKFRSAVYMESKSTMAGKISIFRGTGPRHIHLILNNSEESCHPYYIPGDNHVHSGVSKSGTFSITLPEGSFTSAKLEFRKGESCLPTE